VERSVDSGVNLVPPLLSMGVLAPRNLLQNLVLCVCVVALILMMGEICSSIMPQSRTYLLAIFEQKLSSSSAVSDQTMWKEI